MDEVFSVLLASGIEALNPLQEEVVKKGFEKNLIVAAPTASGKTLIAEIAALKTLKKGKKVVYIVPLRALAQEKYDDFKKKYQPLGYKIGISIGDLDSSDTWLSSYDIIIVTSEKLDSLLRHGIAWAGSIGLVVADEIHLLHDPDRGPTLEVVLTRLLDYHPLILGLSATIRNYEELASWLHAESVKSDFRPVQLYRGICFDNEVNFVPQRQYTIGTEHVLEELTNITKQSLVFISTRKGTEATAEKLGKNIFKRLSPEEKTSLQEISRKVASSLEHKTTQCERLARCIEQGAAFHHAGLTYAQRSSVEEGFKKGLIKVICATPTLAAGLNLPAYRVIIRDLKRFSSYRGMDYLPALEAAQMMGRAGRPAYDTEGEAILLPKNKTEAEYSWNTYIQGETEKIYSKLGVEPVLRTHVLALIAGGVVGTRKELIEFFGKTFYAHQYKDMTQITIHLDKILDMLEKFRFITLDGGSSSPFKPAFIWEEEIVNVKATKIGQRVSELYIDPLTADFLIKSLTKIEHTSPTFFTYLHMIASCMEMRPSLSLRKKDFEEVPLIAVEEEKNLIEKPPNEWDIDYEDFLRGVKMTSFLQHWAEEKGEDYLLETFGVTPGELRARLDIADWLLYSAAELGLLLGQMEQLKNVKKVRLRVKYGIKEELLALIRLKGVGRVRARKLFDHGIKGISDLRKTPLETLENIVGKGTGVSIKEQVGGKL